MIGQWRLRAIGVSGAVLRAYARAVGHPTFLIVKLLRVPLGFFPNQ